MLEHWDESIINEFKGICGKLYSMHYYLNGNDRITFIEFTKAKHFLFKHRDFSVKIFNASGTHQFWWNSSNQEIRKQFVKYLSEIE